MKNFFAIFGVAVILCVSVSCKDKNNKGAITPDYSATGNPYPQNQTVTGSTTYTSPATKNTSFSVGDIGWSNPTCISTGSTSLRATKDNIDVVITFAAPITYSSSPVTYMVSDNLQSGTCRITVYNAPDQPAGVYWYGKGGSVVISTNATSINAKLVGVMCTQKEFNFPQVIVNGGVACSQ